jgi:hypothetical protein
MLKNCKVDFLGNSEVAFFLYTLYALHQNFTHHGSAYVQLKRHSNFNNICLISKGLLPFFLYTSIRNIVLVISLCILERGNKIWYIYVSSEIVAGLHDMILLEYFRNQKNKFAVLLWHREANRSSFYTWSKKNNVCVCDGYMVYQWVTQGTKGSIDNAWRPGCGSVIRPLQVPTVVVSRKRPGEL